MVKNSQIVILKFRFVLLALSFCFFALSASAVGKRTKVDSPLTLERLECSQALLVEQIGVRGQWVRESDLSHQMADGKWSWKVEGARTRIPLSYLATTNWGNFIFSKKIDDETDWERKIWEGVSLRNHKDDREFLTRSSDFLGFLQKGEAKGVAYLRADSPSAKSRSGPEMSLVLNWGDSEKTFSLRELLHLDDSISSRDFEYINEESFTPHFGVPSTISADGRFVVLFFENPIGFSSRDGRFHAVMFDLSANDGPRIVPLPFSELLREDRLVKAQFFGYRHLRLSFFEERPRASRSRRDDRVYRIPTDTIFSLDVDSQGKTVLSSLGKDWKISHQDVEVPENPFASVTGSLLMVDGSRKVVEQWTVDPRGSIQKYTMSLQAGDDVTVAAIENLGGKGTAGLRLSTGLFGTTFLFPDLEGGDFSLVRKEWLDFPLVLRFERESIPSSSQKLEAKKTLGNDQ